ncbi:MAG TPA: ATP-binding cassette domain-containing protein [Burkholderiales bacterium]|nr:ATP-binding cassette domain-containing protein [Burkholderiales bacterium]
MSRGVEIRELMKNFVLTRWSGLRRRVSDVVAVDGISLSVPPGQSVAFIGPNGAGKSTTIKMLTGILHPTSGEVSVLGFIPWRDRRRLAHQIGAVFGQRSQLWYHLPPGDTFDLLSRIYSLKREEFVRTRNVLIERFNLGSFMNTPVRKLSLGQRMRAEVAASLLHRPKVLFLDEPTIGLDVIARQELRNLICEWNRNDGTTIFLTSHDAGDIEHVAERVIVINHGQVVVDDNVAAVRRKYLGAKILRVQFHEVPRPVLLPGVTVLCSSEYEWKLQIDTAITPVRRVTSAVLDAGSVADIAVEDPPLEEVIARIYCESRREVPS